MSAAVVRGERLRAALLRLRAELAVHRVELVVPEGVCSELSAAGLSLREIVAAVREAALVGPGLLEVGCREVVDLPATGAVFSAQAPVALSLMRLG